MTLSPAQYWINPEKNIEIKYVLLLFFVYIYILDSVLRDSAFLIKPRSHEIARSPNRAIGHESHLLLFFDCLNGDGYGKSRLVRSTIGSRLCDIGCNEGKMCVCLLFP